MASSSNSPCAACKFLRRKCTPECVFAPYFPPDQPQKFANVHKVFGASNVTKLLNELHPHQREDAVNSLAYEADARLRDPVYGCVGVISLLQHQLKQLQSDLTTARSELSKYINAGMAGPLLGGPSSNLGIGMGLPGTASRDHLFRDQVMEAQISTRDQQMLQGLPATSGTAAEELALPKARNKSGLPGLISYPKRLLMPITCVRFLMFFFPESFAFGKKNTKIKSFSSLRRHLLKRLYCSNNYFSLFSLLLSSSPLQVKVACCFVCVSFHMNITLIPLLIL